MTPHSIALLSADSLSGDRISRWRQLASAVAIAPPCDLLVLPYLAAYPPFWREIDRAAGFANGERAPFASATALQSIVAERKTPLLTTVFEVVAEGVFYATAVLLAADGGSQALYRQEHALNLPECRERLYFQPGMNEDLPVLQIGELRLGLQLGGDLWVPESARRLRLAGVNALLAITGADGRTLAEARSIENGVPVVYSGSTVTAFGADDVNEHSPWTVVEIDPTRIAARMTANDPLQMRRPRLYTALSATWEGAAE